MDRKTACLVQEKMCRERASERPHERDHWLAEAAKWAHASKEPTGRVAVTHEVKDGRMIPKPAKGP